MSEILVLAEIENGTLHSTAGELLAAARKLAAELNLDVSAALFGEITEDITGEVVALGADNVYTASHPKLASNVADAHVAALEQICQQASPTAVLTAKTPLGRVVGPRLAYRLGVGVAQDCMNVTGEKISGKITVTRPVYGGNAMAAFTFTDKNPQFIVVRVKAFEAMERDDSRVGRIVELDMDIADDQIKVKLIETVKEESEGVKLEDASVIVSGGRGLGGPEPFSQLEELAKMFNGAVGASRAVCDAGWLDHSYQVGLTGKTVSPDLYITVGISGASQHMAGCSSSKSIVAINKDSEANIFKEASFGVVGDWEKVLPSFTATVQELLSS